MILDSKEERELIDLQRKLHLKGAELNELQEDLRRAKSNFREVEKRFRRLAEATSEGLLIYEEGKIVDVNSSFVSMFGFSQLEIVGINAIEIALPGSSDVIKRKLASGEEHIEEVEAVRKDGSVFMCEIQVKTIPYHNRKLGVVIVKDINECEQEKQAVRKRDEKLLEFEHIVSSSTDMMALIDKKYRYLTANNSYLKAFGKNIDELIGSTVADVFGEEFFEEVIKPKVDRCLKGEVVKYQEWFDFPAFAPKYMDITLSPYTDADDNVLGFVVNGRDITERKHAEEMAREADRKFRSVVQTAPNGIITVDSKGSIIFWNNSAERIYGYTSEEAIGKPLTFIIPERLREKHLTTRRAILSGEAEIKNDPVNVIGLRKDGNEFPLELSLAKWQLKGETFFTEIIHDISDREKAEEEKKKKRQEIAQANKELRKAFAKEEKLRSALTNAEKLASLGEMASKIAHEINNPLTVIKAQAEIRAQMVTDKALKESLLMIKAKADQIKVLTRGYMNLAKPEEVELTNIKLQDVLKTTVRTLLPLGQLKHIKISEEYMKDEPSIFGDPGRLEQVFRNLIINAVDAMAGKSSSEIKIGTKLSEDGKSVDAYVKDNGVGIEEEDIEKIFEPYYTKKEREAGTGLGLVIVKETTENVHGGKLKVESNLGKGTEFHVIIPIAERSRMKKKLLIVDDDDSIAELLALYFTNKGLNVNTAKNGRIAVDTIKKFKPDLVLSDIEMPELDGFGLVDEARKMNPGQRFVMITGFDDRAESSARLKEIDIPLIMKPPDLEDELWPIIKEKLEIA